MGYAFDVLALCLIIAWTLSFLAGSLPALKGDAKDQEREARRRLFLPVLGSLGLVALGSGSAYFDAWSQGPDHCGDTLIHAPGLCWLHPETGSGLTPFEILVALALAVTGLRLLRLLASWGLARAGLARLEALPPSAHPNEAAVLTNLGWKLPARVVASKELLCFVHGLWRPKLVISNSVFGTLSETELACALAHEAAHVSRRDPAWRLLGRLASLGHFPGLGERSFQRWILAQEALCDATAARRMGSLLVVAEALVSFQRALNRNKLSSSTLLGTAFASAEAFEARVRQLLFPERTAPWQLLARPWPWALALLLLWQAEGVHRALEALLRVLHW